MYTFSFPLFMRVIFFAGCLGCFGNMAFGQCVPPIRALYNVTLTGNTSNGGNFVRNAKLLVDPTITAAGVVNLNNGQNHREIGIVSGNPYATPQPGAIHFVTNTALCKDAGTGCGSTPVNAALDVVYTSLSGNQLDITLDGTVYNNSTAGNVLTANFLNSFSATGSVTASLYQISSGTINLTFGNNGQTVSGVINITGGSGIFGTGTSTYSATITGSCASAANCSCNTLPNLTQQSATMTITNSKVTYHLYVKNVGNNAAGAFKIRYYIAKDKNNVATRRILGEEDFSILAAGEITPLYRVFENACNLSGISSGDYYIGYTIDPYNDVTETNEADNDFISGSSQGLTCTLVSHWVTALSEPSDGGYINGRGPYLAGQTATLTAEPTPGWFFTEWRDGNNFISSNPSIGFTVPGYQNLKAYFTCGNQLKNIRAVRRHNTALVIGWDDLAEAKYYQMRYRETGASIWQDTFTEFNINGSRIFEINCLKPGGRQYDIQLRSTECAIISSTFTNWTPTLVTSTVSFVQAPYCTNYGAGYFYIKQFVIGNRTITTGNNGGLFVFNPASSFFNITPGNSYPFTLTPGTDDSGFTSLKGFFVVWADWNQNNIFDSDELIFQKETLLNTPVNGELKVPAHLNNGQVRLRIAITWLDSNKKPDPCGFDDRCTIVGEVEDYPLTINTTDIKYPAHDVNLTAYPNPASQNLYIAIPDNVSVRDLHVMDVQGKTLLSQNIHNGQKPITIPVRDIPNGLYIVRIGLAEGRTAFLRFVKEQ